LAALIPIGPISHQPKLDYTNEELKQVKILKRARHVLAGARHPQTIETVRQWFADAGLVDVYVGTGFKWHPTPGKTIRVCSG